MIDAPPVLLVVVLGFILKRLGILKKEMADILLNIIFYIFLPAMLYYSLTRIEIKQGLFILPFCGLLIALFSYVFAGIIKGYMRMEKTTEGSFIMMAGAMNQALFTYPFFLIYYGVEGLSYAAFFDLGQAVLALTLAYYIASCYSGQCDSRESIKNVIQFPSIWALGIALALNYFQLTSVLAPIEPMIALMHDITSPLIMLSLGVFIEPQIKKPKPMVIVLLIRFVFSLMFALLLTQLLGLSGIERKVVLIASAAPPAMVTLIYSSMKKLDTEYTAATISAAIIIGLAYTPLLFSVL